MAPGREAVVPTRPLEHIRVLDFTHAASGPFATMLMGDLGAQVIKVERPDGGDLTRGMGHIIDEPEGSEYYLALNRNKKSIALDLTDEQDRERARGLASQVDVVIQNFRPGVIESMGLGFDDVAASNPGLVYCSISAFGDSGPWGTIGGNDLTVQAASGLIALTGDPDGPPTRIGASVTDFTTGLFAFNGIITALLARDAAGQAQHVKIDMLTSALALMPNFIPRVTTLDKRTERAGIGSSLIAPYGAYYCADGVGLIIGAFSDRIWVTLCETIGRSDLITDARFVANQDRVANRSQLDVELNAWFGTMRGNAAEELLVTSGVPATRITELYDAVRTPQAEHLGVIAQLRGERAEVGTVRNPIRCEQWGDQPLQFPPALGADTEHVLKEFGLS